MIRVLRESWVLSQLELKKRRKWYIYPIWLFGMLFAFLIFGKGIESFTNIPKYGMFFSSGMIIFFVIIIGIFSGIKIRKNKLFLSLPISKFSIIFAKIISTFLLSMQSFYVLFVLLLFFFASISLSKILLSIPLFLFTIIVSCFFGVLLATLFKKYAETVGSFIFLFIIFSSSLFYPIEKLSIVTKLLFYLNPFSYFVDVFRFISTGNSSMNFPFNLLLMLLFGFFCIFFSSYLYDIKARKEM